MLAICSSTVPNIGRAFNLSASMFAMLMTVLAAASCATEPEDPADSDLGQRTVDELTGTAQQPLQDFNILQGEISPILLDAKTDPYARPVTEDCQSLIVEIRELDRALGADLDVVQSADSTAVDTTIDTTFAVARSVASGIIPYRGVTRQLTGAEARSREINEAILAGTVRRAYFKGIGSRIGCEYPGSPNRQNFDPDE